MNMNAVFIAGNLTRDPDSKKIPNGTTVVRLGVAINHTWKDRQTGEQRQDTTFVDVEVWGQPADFCAEHLRKGASVVIEGALQLQTWDDRQTGQKRSKLLVKARRVQSERVEAQRTQAAAAPAAAAPAPAPVAQPAAQPLPAPGPGPAPGEYGPDEDIGDIPF